MESIQITLQKKFAAPLPDFYKRRIVFWHDADKEFVETVEENVPDGVKLLKLTGTNWFYAKKLLYIDDTVSDYLVYVPFGFEKYEDNWLGDIMRYSESFRADQISMRMDELGIIEDVKMRKLMKKYKKFFDSKERIAKLQKFGTKYDSIGKLHIDVLSVICNTRDNNLFGIVEALLVDNLCNESDEIISDIQKYDAEDVLQELLLKKLGFSDYNAESFMKLAGYILISRLSTVIDRSLLIDFNQLLADISYAQACSDIISTWITSSDDSSLFDIAKQVENTYHIPEKLSKLEIEQIINAECLPCINDIIIRKAMIGITEDRIKAEELLKIIEKRRMLKWYDSYQYYYEGLFYAAQMKKFLLDHYEGYHYADCHSMAKAYTNELCNMDTYYRKFHVAFKNSIGQADSELEDMFKNLADYVEGLYKNTFLAQLGNMWTALAKDELAENGCLKGINRQSDFYNNYVSQMAKSSRVFVVISDALRFEVAKELNEMLMRETKGKAELSYMQSIFPTATKFGMAALLPHTELTITDDIKVLCDRMSTEGTLNREKVLQTINAGNVAITSQELFKLKIDELREKVKKSEVVYVFHNQIDAIGDKQITEDKVFDACKDAVIELCKIVSRIANVGSNIFITADHGFIYTYHSLSESDKVEKDIASGDILECDHRYMLMNSDGQSDYLMPVTMKQYSTEIKGFTPSDYIRIKKQGGVNYVHGGTSLQEMIIPIITFKNMRSDSKGFKSTNKVTLQLLSQTRRVSNSIVRLDFFQPEIVGGKTIPNEFELFFSDENGKLISDVQLIIADSTSDDVKMRTYRKQFSMKSLTYKRENKYYLNIQERSSSNLPERIEFTINIAFTDDFGF